MSISTEHPAQSEITCHRRVVVPVLRRSHSYNYTIFRAANWHLLERYGGIRIARADRQSACCMQPGGPSYRMGVRQKPSSGRFPPRLAVRLARVLSIHELGSTTPCPAECRQER